MPLQQQWVHGNMCEQGQCRQPLRTKTGRQKERYKNNIRMIIRVVQMTFKEEAVEEFMTLFQQRQDTIRGFRGCTHLELWQDSIHSNIFFTHSHWQTQADLDHYRFSDFFKDT